MNIDSIKNGYVIDHIQSGKAMKIYEVLNLNELDCQVAIITNAKSKKTGKKDIIKIDREIDINLDTLGFIDHNITVNVVKDDKIIEKRKLNLPEKVVNVAKCNNPRCITSIEKDLDQIFILTDKEKEDAIYNQEFEKAAYIRDEEKELKNNLEKALSNWRKKKNKDIIEITGDNVAEIISKWTGIPVQKLTQDDNEKLKNLEEELHKRVVGQEDAIKAVSKAIRRGRIGLKDPKRPIGSFLFLGPTGVGKTELSKALTQILFENENSMVRVDMSEYMEAHSISKLIGSPPGYVGYDDAGQLTEKVKRKPYSIILLDEIEKAHPDVFNILLQVLDDGKLTDSQGNTTNFENTIIIMTSNAGSNLNTNSIGFGKSTTDNGKVNSALRELFRPEFLNRVDEIITFNSLTQDELLQIVDLLLKNTENALANKDIGLSVSLGAKKYILEKGTDLKYGARPLRRAIQKYIEDEIAELLLRSEVSSGQTVKVDCRKDELKFSVK